MHINKLVEEKRKTRGKWQRTKDKLITAIQENRNATFQHYITTLTPSDYYMERYKKV